MEDGNYESGKMRYVADLDNLNQLPVATVAGWTCDRPHFEVREKRYETNFGIQRDCWTARRAIPAFTVRLAFRTGVFPFS